ncbi:hypothetical protein ABLB37_19195 [Vibrio parahaemolyticus]|uniref:hypothetical protein n=1 Tax=Vibrio harveyi group TaxID=717610 RepID=UPI0015F6107C|nr:MULTISPECIES: hypothetical protein [Vibrio harveyi group]EJE8520993.1 hypothetical protein [Vibrio parahaemolyticus]MBS9948798.1 hypothetical protein [Vibrio alginolyticus]
MNAISRVIFLLILSFIQPAKARDEYSLAERAALERMSNLMLCDIGFDRLWLFSGEEELKTVSKFLNDDINEIATRFHLKDNDIDELRSHFNEIYPEASKEELLYVLKNTELPGLGNKSCGSYVKERYKDRL